MVDPKDHIREDFIIDKNDAGAEAEDFHREEYYGQNGNIFRKKSYLPIIVGGAALIVLVLIFGVIFSGRNDSADREYLQSLEARIEQLENKLAAIDTRDQVPDQIARQERELNTMGERLKSFESTVSTQIDQIIKELGALHQKIDRAPAAKAKSVPSTEKKTEAAAPKKTETAEFYQVQAGDTLYRISRRFGLTVEQLRSYNSIAPDASIYPGQKLRLTPKRKP
jgi:LysM repeat protein